MRNARRTHASMKQLSMFSGDATSSFSDDATNRWPRRGRQEQRGQEFRDESDGAVRVLWARFCFFFSSCVGALTCAGPDCTHPTAGDPGDRMI
jgi:hypothetical protein